MIFFPPSVPPVPYFLANILVKRVSTLAHAEWLLVQVFPPTLTSRNNLLALRVVPGPSRAPRAFRLLPVFRERLKLVATAGLYEP